MDHSKPVKPPEGPTVCPFKEEEPTVGPEPVPVRRQPIERNDGIEPECDIKEPQPIPEGFVRPKPANGYPVPTEEQKNRPRPGNFNENLHKLIVLGFAKERAENALIAADFDLKKAMNLLHGK